MVAEHLKRCCVQSTDLCINGFSRRNKTKTCFQGQYLCNRIVFPVGVLNKCHAFASFNDTSVPLLRCAFISTTNSTEEIA